MALIASGITRKGVQLVWGSPVAGRLYTISLIDAPSNFLTYVGYLYIARLNPSIGRSAQLDGKALWVKDTAIQVPSPSPATYRIVAAWRLEGFQWELHDFL
jgi:hypothetical protein